MLGKVLLNYLLIQITMDHELVVADNATITLVDANGKKAVVNVSETTKDSVLIKFNSFASRDNGFGQGVVKITATSGLTNQDNQVLDLDASHDVVFRDAGVQQK